MAEKSSKPRSSAGTLAVPTYTTGLLQAQAYRNLKQLLSVPLGKHGLGLTEWALLGLLYQNGGMRARALAEQLQVEPSLVTTLLSDLHSRGYISRNQDPDDNRAKLIELTGRGSKLLPMVERTLRSELKRYLTDVSSAELLVYIDVLAKIAHKPAK